MSEQPELPSRAAPAGADAALPTRGELPSRDAAGPSTDAAAEARASTEGRASASATGAEEAGMAERIRACTAAGGLGQALPADFGDPAGDWRSVQADEPFERLYLDWRQADRVTPALVRHHYNLLLGFWTDVIRRMQTGAAGTQIARRYGGRYASPEMVKSYPGELERALHRLADEAGIRAAFAERADRRLTRAREQLDPLVRQALLDGALSSDEAEYLVDEGARLGLSREETARLVLATLAERGFKPMEAVDSASPLEQLTGTRWATDQAQRSPRARNPFAFKAVAVSTLAELASACTRHPEEAQGYLYNGYLEAWLAGDLGLGPLAARVHAILTDYPKRRDRGLEVFVRAILEQVGIDASPRMLADPPALDLGPVPQGAGTTGRLALRELGGRYAWGRITAAPEIAGVHVPAAFDGDGTVEIGVDAGWLPHGAYVVTLSVEPRGGQRLEVAVRFEVVPLEVRLQPDALHLATRFGRAAVRRVGMHVGPAGGVLLGSAELAQAIPGLSIAASFDGAEPELAVRLDGGALRAGSRRSTEVLLATNAGELRLPVSIHVRFDAMRALLWGILGAAVGGMGMMTARHLLVQAAGEPRWILTEDDMHGVRLTATLLLALLAAGILAVRWIVREAAKVPSAPHP